jgi:hypothetical protein
MSSYTPTLEGTFSSDTATAFIDALSLLSEVDVKKVILDFKGDGTKKLSIVAMNSANIVNVKLNFDACLLDGFNITQDFSFGIADLSDFVGIVDVFKSGFTLKMSEDIASISSHENYLDYYGADKSRIKRGESGELDCKRLATVQCDESYKEFMKAMGKLVDKNHIVFKGDMTKKTISMSVMDKDVRGNAFSKLIQDPNLGEEFKIAINKDYFRKILTTSCSFNIYREAIQLTKTAELYNIEYLILTLV